MSSSVSLPSSFPLAQDTQNQLKALSQHAQAQLCPNVGEPSRDALRREGGDAILGRRKATVLSEAWS
jgi:hypothetical protein